MLAHSCNAGLNKNKYGELLSGFPIMEAEMMLNKQISQTYILIIYQYSTDKKQS